MFRFNDVALKSATAKLLVQSSRLIIWLFSEVLQFRFFFLYIVLRHIDFLMEEVKYLFCRVKFIYHLLLSLTKGEVALYQIN